MSFLENSVLKRQKRKEKIATVDKYKSLEREHKKKKTRLQRVISMISRTLFFLTL